MSNVETLPTAQPRGVVAEMADKFGMRADAFELMVRATCSPAPKRGEEAVPLTREEFAAFMLVASHYDLNPLTREIYAYPKRGGGVVPIVSVDGWLNLINRQPTCDGFDIIANMNAQGALVSYTCTMYRKDRSHPIVVTEYLSECVRETEPWKMKHRMLRHKALIQAGRYTFGFAGIYDEDEAERIAGEPARETRKPPVPPALIIEHKPGVQMATIEGAADRAEVAPARRTPPAPPPVPPVPQAQQQAIDFDDLRAKLSACSDEDTLNAAFEEWMNGREAHMSPDEIDEANAVLREAAAPYWKGDE